MRNQRQIAQPGENSHAPTLQQIMKQQENIQATRREKEAQTEQEKLHKN